MKPTARICITGSELTRGETRDINGSFLGTRLTMLGVAVDEIILVPDDSMLLEEAIRESIERADIVVTSGGLGPTADDHTVRVLARAVGRETEQDAEARDQMRARILKRVGSEDRIPSNYYKQAEVVAGSKVLYNPIGLAPGSLVETRRGFAAALPGVPREMRAMFDKCLAPEIAARFELTAPRVARAKILGIGESWAEARIQALGIDFGRLEYGISARPGELLIKLIAHAPDDHALVDDAIDALAREFGDAFLALPESLIDASGREIDVGHTRLLHEALVRSGRTIATAESCTGGLVAKYLTDQPGSSAYFLGAVVAYHNHIKESALGVSAALLKEHGAVSDPVCRAMARGARQRFGADYGVGVTGIAGPDGGSDEKPVGLVFVGIATPERTLADEVIVTRNRFWGDRPMVREQAALRALEMVRADLSR